MKSIHVKITVFSFLLLCSMSTIPTEARVQSYEFVNFTDFLSQYGAASSEDKTLVIVAYIEWQELNGGFPAIQNDTNVVFIYYNSGGASSSCDVTGDFTGWSTNGASMTQLATDVNFFYREMVFDPTARLDYKFILSGSNWILDSRNPNTVSGGFGPNSELSMPHFIQPTAIIFREEIDHGTVTTLPEPWTSPRVKVYLPPNYNASLSYPSIYTSDGSEYITLGSAVTILDNLIADQIIDPVIAVFIDPYGDRIDWYNCNSSYLDYLDGLVSFIDGNYSTKVAATARLHLGDSMGGLVSAYVALERPDIFKLVGSHSGAFWVGSTYNISGKYETANVSLDLKMWFSAGTYEPTIISDTYLLANYSLSHGWLTEAIYLYEGHSWGSWRHTMDDMLTYFFPHTGLFDLPVNVTTDPSDSVTTDPPTSSIPMRIDPILVFILGTVFVLLKRRKLPSGKRS